jgi:hypothetical protein
MKEQGSCDKRLELIYKYFSHHIRTNTSVVVAMLDVIKEGLSDDSMMDMIMESGYLLDVFDRGMSISFNHILGKEEENFQEEIDLKLFTELFATNALPKDGSCNISITIPEGCFINCNGYTFKSIYQILLHEAALSTEKEMSVSFQNNSVSIKPDKGFNDINPIYFIFAEVLQKSGIQTELDKAVITLRF